MVQCSSPLEAPCDLAETYADTHTGDQDPTFS